MQMGLPVVTIQKVSNTEYKLTQKRFLSNPNDYDAVHEASEFKYVLRIDIISDCEFLTFIKFYCSYRWSIPITYTTSASPTVQRDWFYYDQSESK